MPIVQFFNTVKQLVHVLADAIEPVTQSLILSGTGKLAFQYQTVCKIQIPIIQIPTKRIPRTLVQHSDQITFIAI